MSQTLPVTLGHGTTLSASLSSHANTVALFASARDGSTASGSAPSKAARAVFFTHYDDQQLERKDFRNKAYAVWASLQVRQCPEQRPDDERLLISRCPARL